MKRWMVVLIVGFVAAILHVQLLLSSIGDLLEPSGLDLWFNLRGSIEPPRDVVVVSLDEPSYKVLQVPLNEAWPRALHAELLEKLAEYGAKRVAMDIVFVGKGRDPAVDQRLAEAIKKIPTVLGVDHIRNDLQGTEDLLEPEEFFLDNVETRALVQMPDDGGIIRRFFVKRFFLTKDIPTLCEAGAGKKAGDPTLPKERDFIWYYGPRFTVDTVSYHEVLNPKGSLPKERFQNKIVFVGINLQTELGPAQKDSFKTPFYERGRIFGVEIQATAALNLLTNTWIRRSSKWIEGLGYFFLTWLVTSVLVYLKPQWGIVFLLGFAVLWATASYLSFLSGYFLPGVILVSAVLPLSYLGSTLGYYLVTYRKQQQVERAFQLYLSPDMAREMRNNPKGLELGGESVYATALFTDIAGFTEVTEQMTATQVSNMLNAYFTEVMNVVFEKNGTLIKFIGDAVFVIWGAPIKINDHAKLACETALLIHREVERFNASRRFPPLHTRIGVHTGPMVVGNLGSEKRFDYTAIGDSVNLASRVEGINKYFGTNIIITDVTKRELASALQPLTLGSIMVVGKKERIGIHTLFDQPISQELQEEWSKALSAFRNKKWVEARELLKSIELREIRLKGACQLYLEEIKIFEEDPPSDDWQGEVVFSKK